MKKNGFLFSLFVIVLVVHIHAQNTPAKYLGSYTQPAPNVAALGKYVDFPIGYYTGTPEISVPVYNLKDGAANVPISLSYHASGIKVPETASWVGIGWALNASGMVTRTVRGAPDEGSKVPGIGTFPRGYYQDSGLTKMAHLPNPLNGFINAGDSNLEMTTNTIWQMSAGASDGEPDLFTFNFNGYSGKFVFDEYRTPHLLGDQDIKIAYTFGGILGTFTTWIFTTPDGTKYYFGENSNYEVTLVKPTGGFQDPNSTYPSSWFLTRIVYPNTKDTVYYNYTPESYSYFDLGQETKIFLDAGGNNGGNNLVNACSINDPADLPKNIYYTTVNGLRLTSIKSTNYNIVFGVRNIRQDMITSNAYSLDSIKIYNSAGQSIKQVQLSYGYFKSTTSNNVGVMISGPMGGDTTDTKRLKLLSVQEYSGDGLSSKPAYVFSYQETVQLPRRISYDQDGYGFSNNHGGSSNNKFTPKVYHSICNNLGGFTYANRQSQWPDMQAFSIKTIKDPLGVTTLFEFEPHTSHFVYNGDTLIGGLRIHKITTTDSVTGRSQIRSFSYGSGGVLYHIPQYLISPVNEYYWLGYVWPLNTTYAGYSFDHNLVLFLLKQSQSVVPLQDFQGNHIGYPIVKEIFGLNGEGGSKVYYFMADQNVRGNSRLDMSNFTANATITNGPFGAQSGLYGNGQWNQIAPENLAYYQGYNVFSYYPEAPQQVDFRRGQLMSEETYDSSNNLIRNVINTYKETYNEKNRIRGFKSFRVSHTAANAGNISYPTGYYDAMTFYKLHTGISHLISTYTTDYKDGKSMTSITNYGYESAYHTQKTSDTTVNSQGDSTINKTYYSFDYTNGATTDNVFGKMKARNMLMPTATRTWKNNLLIGGTVTLYKDFATNASDTFINPSKIYAIETTTPLTTAQAGENVALTSQFTTLLPDTYFKEKASFNIDGIKAKIIEQKLVNDKTQALIWDNMLSMPLAQTDNAVFSDVAYSGFESAETGNWTYSAVSVVPDPTAPTGSKAYAISAGISKSGLNSSQKYIVSYWQKGAVTVIGGTQSNSISGGILNGYTYKQITITGTTSISLSGTSNIDEVRLYPAAAQMTTYTYDAIMRLIAQCSVNNTISYYEYDSMNRLIDIKDQFGNVIKSFEYNYGRASRPGQ